MQQRVIGAAVLVPVAVVVFLAGQPAIWLGIALLGAAAAYETAQLTSRSGVLVNARLAVVAPPLAVLGVFFAALPGGDPFFPAAQWEFFALAGAVWVIGTAVVALRDHDPLSGFRTWLGTLFATGYPSLLAFAAAIVMLGGQQPAGDFLGRPLDRGQLWLLTLVLTVWAMDSAAYLVGRSLPRGRFMNHISPNKTWSGAIGGTVAAIAVCTLLVSTIGSGGPVFGVALGAVIAITAQAGDLAESMLKRAAAAKDSGTLIPGHGGILDRVDSFLFAAPAMFAVMLVMVKTGGGV